MFEEFTEEYQNFPFMKNKISRMHPVQKDRCKVPNCRPPIDAMHLQREPDFRRQTLGKERLKIAVSITGSMHPHRRGGIKTTVVGKKRKLTAANTNRHHQPSSVAAVSKQTCLAVLNHVSHQFDFSMDTDIIYPDKSSQGVYYQTMLFKNISLQTPRGTLIPNFCLKE